MGSFASLHTLFFNVTNRCNLTCRHCYVNSSPLETRKNELSLDKISNFAREAKDLGAVRVIVSGGEPFIREDILEIFRIFDSMDYSIAVSSNGTLIHPEAITKLRELKNLAFQISLDGDQKQHELLRGISGCFQKTISGIYYLKKGKIPVQINSVICKGNYLDVPFLVKFSRDFDIPIRLTLLNPLVGRGKYMKKQVLNVQEIQRLIQFVHGVRKLGSRVYLNLPPILLPPEDIVDAGGPSCGWARSMCGILHNGDVSICVLAHDYPELIVGNLKEEQFGSLWLKSALFKRLRTLKPTDLKGICGMCPIKKECGGGCRLLAYMKYGDFSGPNPICETFYESGFLDLN